MAVLPGRLAKTLPNVQLQIPPIEVEGFTILMSWHERTHHDIAHAWIRELVVEMMNAVE